MTRSSVSADSTLERQDFLLEVVDERVELAKDGAELTEEMLLLPVSERLILKIALTLGEGVFGLDSSNCRDSFRCSSRFRSNCKVLRRRSATRTSSANVDFLTGYLSPMYASWPGVQ